VFSVRHELIFYILFRSNSVSKVVNIFLRTEADRCVYGAVYQNVEGCNVLPIITFS
jgi:hypothetical protein